MSKKYYNFVAISIVVNVDAIIGKDILVEACLNDSLISRPSAIFLSAYSTTTIAPSTKSPTDKIKAKRTTKLIVKPINAKAKIPVKKDPGIEIPTKKPDLIPKAPKIIIRTWI